MAGIDVSTFPPRKWYRRPPFLSQSPIKTKLTEPHRASSSFASNNVEDGNCSHDQEYETVTPEARANLLSVLTFNWLGRLLRTGYSRPLQADDLYDLPDSRLVIKHADQLEKSWTMRLESNKGRRSAGRGFHWRPFWSRRTSEANILALSLNDVCFNWFWSGGLLKMFGDLAQIASPLLIRFLIETLNDTSDHAYRAGFGYAVALSVVLAISVFTNVHGFYRCATTGILLRAVLMHSIYRRATTRLTQQARVAGDYQTGSLISLMSADVTRIDLCCGFFHSAWTSLLQIVLCLALTIWTLGYSALPGFGLLALLYPLQSFMMKSLFHLRRTSMPFTDARIKAVVEAISNIRLIKTNALEKSLLSKIGKLRSVEVVFIRKRMLLRALNIAVSFTAPALAAVVSIVCYGAVSGDGMKASVIFSSLAFFLLMRMPLGALPIAISSIADARAALERLSAFMVASDDDSAHDTAIRNSLAQKGHQEGSAFFIQVKDATFTYHDILQRSETSNDAALDTSTSARLYLDLFEVRKGQVVSIVGPVASGKSSIFRALLGDMHLVTAKSCFIDLDNSVSSRLAIVPQEAWLLSETIRENIVFGRSFDDAWYDEVLHKCCLQPDLDMLSASDMTIVGEKGVTLSGGQKQRISIARAIYGRPQLLLLDDCFSALDSHVGTQVFDNVVDKRRRSHECTVVLVTHAMGLARRADHIVYMENGRILTQGSFDHLKSSHETFTAYVASSNNQGSSADSPAEATMSLQNTLSVQTDPENGDRTAKLKTQDNQPATQATRDLPGQNISGPKKLVYQRARGEEIMQREERFTGSVNGRTYLQYIRFGNAYMTVPLFIASIIVFQGSSVVSPLWLSWWQQAKIPNTSKDTYMGGYAAWGIGQSLGLFLMSAVFAMFCFWCSNHLHAAALSGVLFAPTVFFATTPQGRISHRFSKDMDAVDNVVGEQLRIFISTLVQVVGTVIIVGIVLPIFLAIAAAVLLLYIWTGMYYRPSARELRRLDNLLRSRIYEHFDESLCGLSTLKAFGVLQRFVDDNAHRIDTENKAYWLSVAAVRWLNLRLDLYGVVLVLVTGLLVVGLRNTITPSSGGVVLSYVVTAQAAFGNMIRFSAEIENNMNSVERLLHYANEIKQRAEHDIEHVDNSLRNQGWPRQGHIKFQSVTLSHRPTLSPALSEVTLDIRPGERVGIVGRTGAGKSSLITALLRLTEPSSGRILVDDVDINTVGLGLLRSSISVISQDAILLAGTIRYNLDPFEQYDDSWLAQCLRAVGLGGVQNKDNNNKTSGFSISEKASNTESSCTRSMLDLDSVVKENGANISHGQRSLISIARALVKRSKIVILDEATASIDVQAEEKLHAMMNEFMGDATSLIIAHRLDTIINSCDRVLVMERGTAIEFDSVSSLYANEDSIFRALCDAAKITVHS